MLFFIFASDINECVATTHDCDISVSYCVNDVPHYHCVCNEFFTNVDGVCQGWYNQHIS